MTDAERQDMLCRTCLFFRPLTDGELAAFTISHEQAPPQNAGECRAHPPSRTTEVFGLFPLVLAEEWCGEWKGNRGGAT